MPVSMRAVWNVAGAVLGLIIIGLFLRSVITGQPLNDTQESNYLCIEMLLCLLLGKK